MKIFRYWWDMDLPTSFHAVFSLFPKQEVRSNQPMFNEIVQAVKTTGCQWELLEWTETRVDVSSN